MQDSKRKQARAIAIAKAQDERTVRIGLVALAISMTAACIYGLLSLVF